MQKYTIEIRPVAYVCIGDRLDLFGDLFVCILRVVETLLISTFLHALLTMFHYVPSPGIVMSGPYCFALQDLLYYHVDNTCAADSSSSSPYRPDAAESVPKFTSRPCQRSEVLLVELADLCGQIQAVVDSKSGRPLNEKTLSMAVNIHIVEVE